MPGFAEELSAGSLQFDSDGWLDSVTNPELCVSFTGGATPNQCLQLDFGPSLAPVGSPRLHTGDTIGDRLGGVLDGRIAWQRPTAVRQCAEPGRGGLEWAAER